MQIQLQVQQNELMQATAKASSPTVQEQLQEKQIAMHETQIELQRQQNELLKQQLQQATPSPPSRSGRFVEGSLSDPPLSFQPTRPVTKTVRMAPLGATTPRRSPAPPLPPPPNLLSIVDTPPPTRTRGFGTGAGFGMSTPRFSRAGSNPPPRPSARKASPQSVRKPPALSPRQLTSERSAKSPDPQALQTPRAARPPPQASVPATKSPPRAATPGQETMKARYRALNTHPERNWGGGEKGEKRRISVAPHSGDAPLWIDGWNYGAPDPGDPTNDVQRKGSPRRGGAGSSTESPRQSPRASTRAQSPKATPSSNPWF